MNGYLKAYDVAKHDPKVIFPSKSGYDLVEDFGEFISVKCNSGGTHLAFIIANQSFTPDGVLYCWDFERNSITSFNFFTGNIADAQENFKSR